MGDGTYISLAPFSHKVGKDWTGTGPDKHQHSFSISLSLLKPILPRIAYLKGINTPSQISSGNTLNAKVHGQFYKKTTPTMVKLDIFLHYLSVYQYQQLPHYYCLYIYMITLYSPTFSIFLAIHQYLFEYATPRRSRGRVRGRRGATELPGRRSQGRTTGGQQRSRT